MEQPLPLQNLVLTLLFRLGVAASIAALIARSIFFQRVLREEERSVDERLLFVLLYGPPVALGVLTRVLLPAYLATDVSLEGALVAGLVGGRMTGMMVGTLAALPAFLNEELLSLPFAVLCGAVGGVLRELCTNKEQVWKFGPFSFLSVPRWLYNLLSKREGNWLMLPLLSCAGLELLRIGLGQAFPGALFYLGGEGWLVVLPVFATIVAVGLTLMIWNNTRIQIKLLDQEQSLLAARMEALTSQINPHFLFNTLNTVASLVRVEPDAARKLVVKLSAILRRLLRKHDNFVPLREELGFIDDYLAIEMVRFGSEKLQFYKQVEEETLELFVPSMLLQPIIENSIRHGLGPRIEGGEIRLRAVRQDGRLLIEVEDNGVGIAEERIPEIYGSGIGISNVNERLKVLYGKDYSLHIESLPNLGTTIRIEIPEVSSS
ncbi:MAG: sensor histidine kinase [Terriglobia bacterium]